MSKIINKSRQTSNKKTNKGKLKLTFNEIYDITLDDVNKNIKYQLGIENKYVDIGETFENDVKSEQFKVTYKIKSQEEKYNQSSYQRGMASSIDNQNTSEEKEKIYEFEINLKQLFEQTEEKGFTIYVPFYELMQPLKKEIQGYANLTISLTKKKKIDTNQNQLL